MKSSCSGSFAGGFTLIELLAVMTIMAILLAVVAPSLAGINESNNISSGGQLFADQVALARQTASARNITVEVRCINVPARSADGYSAIQLWSNSTGTEEPISRMQTLPDGIAISSDQTTISTLFASYSPNPSAMPAGFTDANDNYVSFTVSPSGMVGPLTGVAPDMKTLSVGILPVRSATATALPKNYMLVQVNPVTASTINYRP